MRVQNNSKTIKHASWIGTIKTDKQMVGGRFSLLKQEITHKGVGYNDPCGNRLELETPRQTLI